VWQATEGEPLDLKDQAVLIVGCGAVGSAFGLAFRELGAKLELWSRSDARAQRMAAQLGARVSADLDAAMQRASLVCLAVSDDALEPVAERLAASPGPGGFAFHTNGSAGPEVLAALGERGWQVGKLHPLRAFPQAQTAPASGLQGTWFASAAPSAAAKASCARLVQAFGGHELPLADEPGASLALHSAASLLSGGLVALFDHALDLAQKASRDPAAAQAALRALLDSTARNLAVHEPAEALSGPIARGAVELVEEQLASLPIDARGLYQLLGQRMLQLARTPGGLDAERLEKLEHLLHG